jgi:hypothetical protein
VLDSIIVLTNQQSFDMGCGALNVSMFIALATGLTSSGCELVRPFWQLANEFKSEMMSRHPVQAVQAKLLPRGDMFDVIFDGDDPVLSCANNKKLTGKYDEKFLRWLARRDRKRWLRLRTG